MPVDALGIVRTRRPRSNRRVPELDLRSNSRVPELDLRSNSRVPELDLRSNSRVPELDLQARAIDEQVFQVPEWPEGVGARCRPRTEWS